ncbi:MAG: aminotransferase class III-fold pyridoxal phosphate-dependent enzyme, partial [Pseudomonadota bacterium]|nr:aminotransferase class III-fold pyridoxal phosphate-dependent enzyme [Pseudomonadota bacterium]
DDESAVEKLFKDYGSRIAAVLVEPMPANTGLMIQRNDYLRFLRAITTRHGALLIFDEVISGFRFRYGGYEAGVVPDLVTLGKIIGGGLPVGALTGPADIMDKLAPLGPVYQAGTLSGNPLVTAAGSTVLARLRDRPPYAALDALGARFEAVLIATGNPLARVVRFGSVMWPYFSTADFPRVDTSIDVAAIGRFNRIHRKLLERGFYLPPSGYEVLFISAAHTGRQVEALAAAIGDCLKEDV